MPIERADVRFYLAKTTGVLDKTRPLGDAILAEVIPDVRDAERVSGVQKNYKLHWNVQNPDNLTAKDMRLFLLFPLLGGAVASLVKSTHTQVWTDVASHQKHGCANIAPGQTLQAGVSSSVLVNTRGAAYNHYVVGMTVLLTDVSMLDDMTGKFELLEIASVNWNGDQANLTFTTPVKFGYTSFRTLNGSEIATRVASCINYGDIACGFTVSGNTSSFGTVDVSKLQARNVGAIHQSLTFSFISASSFNVSSSDAGVGSMAPGSITSSYRPIDNNGNAYLSVPSEFWGGTWSAGDSVIIHTTPASVPFFVHLNIPAGTPAIAIETIPITGLFYSGSA